MLRSRTSKKRFLNSYLVFWNENEDIDERRCEDDETDGDDGDNDGIEFEHARVRVQRPAHVHLVEWTLVLQK